MHIFTSISSNYIPKARVLARSVKTHVPDAVFHLLLCDRPPPGFDLAQEDFDHLLTLDELPLEQPRQWIFQHNVVELCTAVKGLGFEQIFRRFDAGKVIFLDPDIAVFSGLENISRQLDRHSILLTPHQTEPEDSYAAILDSEVSSLKFGVFNLGFLAVRNSAEGRRFIDWWSRRLLDFCYDERGQGLFTDQKWADLVPAFFPDLGIVRDPACNVSTWNINRRHLSGTVPAGLRVDGEPLCFYHFSGLDSGAMKVMMELYGGAGPLLGELRDWYLQQCDAMGQRELGAVDCSYDLYSNGERIRPAERLLYRYREELRERFPDPFDCGDDGGYQAWYRRHAGDLASQDTEREQLSVVRRELEAIQHSISWRAFKTLTTAYRRLGTRLGLGRVLRRLNGPS